jgi:hypothetical protein
MSDDLRRWLLVLATSWALVGCGTSDRPVPRSGVDRPPPPPDAGPADASHRIHPGPDGGDEMSMKHTTFDGEGAPTNHTDLLWGDYIDKEGKPAVGWHSHDPVKGNAQ